MKKFLRADFALSLLVLMLPIAFGIALDYLADITGGTVNVFSKPTFETKVAGILRLFAWILPLMGIAFAIFKKRTETKSNDVLFVCFVIGCLLVLPTRIMFAFFNWDK